MDLEFEKIIDAFNHYINECRNDLKEMTFSLDEINNSYYIKANLIKKGKVNSNISVSDALKIYRNSLIDIKYNHTMRVVSDTTRVSQKMHLNASFETILKVSALLHDIGRFPQAINSNDFNDRKCNIFNGENHAEYGYRMLYINNDFEKFFVPEKFRYVISNPVRYHQMPILTGDLTFKFNQKEELDVDKYVTGKECTSYNEKIIIAALVQMVKDVDMLDILYQHLTGEFPVIKDFICYKINNNKLEEISKHFGLSIDEIKKYNGLVDNDISNLKEINIPTGNIEPKRLKVPKDIEKRFFNNENIDLNEIKSRRDFTFIIGMWWRLNHFLNNINFVANLEVVKENELLEKIYAIYPDKYKPLVVDAFEFAQAELINKTISQNKGRIYVKRT